MIWRQGWENGGKAVTKGGKSTHLVDHYLPLARTIQQHLHRAAVNNHSRFGRMAEMGWQVSFGSKLSSSSPQIGIFGHTALLLAEMARTAGKTVLSKLQIT